MGCQQTLPSAKSPRRRQRHLESRDHFPEANLVLGKGVGGGEGGGWCKGDGVFVSDQDRQEGLEKLDVRGQRTVGLVSIQGFYRSSFKIRHYHRYFFIPFTIKL